MEAQEAKFLFLTWHTQFYSSGYDQLLLAKYGLQIYDL